MLLLCYFRNVCPPAGNYTGRSNVRHATLCPAAEVLLEVVAPQTIIKTDLSTLSRKIELPNLKPI